MRAVEHAAARDVVGVGSVEPHWFAGLTGSYKTLSVGVLPRAEIERSHRLATSPSARPFALTGNPVHESIAATFRELAAGRTVCGVDLLGEHRAVGEPLANLARLLPHARRRWGRAVRTPLAFLVAVVAPPLDRTLYQAEKGIKNSEHAVADGGAVVLDAACADGVGPGRFVELLAGGDAAGEIAPDYRLGDHKAVRIRALRARGVAMALVAPGFPADAAEACGISLVDDLEAGAAWLRSRVAAGARGAIVEDAGHAVVHVSP